jgi:hypothetical protein
MTHPPWCSAGRCEAGLGGAHSSEPRAVDFDRDGSAAVRLRAWQRPQYAYEELMDRHTPQVLAELIAGDVDSGKRCRADLTVRQARQLNAQLISMLIEIGDEE